MNSNLITSVTSSEVSIDDLLEDLSSSVGKGRANRSSRQVSDQFQKAIATTRAGQSNKGYGLQSRTMMNLMEAYGTKEDKTDSDHESTDIVEEARSEEQPQDEPTPSLTNRVELEEQKRVITDEQLTAFQRMVDLQPLITKSIVTQDAGESTAAALLSLRQGPSLLERVEKMIPLSSSSRTSFNFSSFVAPTIVTGAGGGGEPPFIMVKSLDELVGPRPPSEPTMATGSGQALDEEKDCLARIWEAVQRCFFAIVEVVKYVFSCGCLSKEVVVQDETAVKEEFVIVSD